jgi:threonine dehydrogenase-like Zn-dependent dehydrogenase
MQHSVIRFVADQQAELQPFTYDTPLAANEVAGSTVVSLVSAGTELNMYCGHYHSQKLAWGMFPCSPGYASVIRVEETGSEVKDLKPGDLVFSQVRHASYQRCKREDAYLLPTGLTPQAATLARLMLVTMTTLTTTAARPPEKVLVTGLGLVGYLGALIFQACGYEVIACDPIAERQEAARAAGLRAVGSVLTEEAGKIALVLECSGHEQAVLDGCRAVQKGGEVVLVGVPMTRKTDLYAQPILNAVFRGHVLLRGGNEWEIPMKPESFRHGSRGANITAALRWLAEGKISVGDIFQTVSPRDPQQVYQDVLHKRHEKTAVVLEWSR